MNFWLMGGDDDGEVWVWCDGDAGEPQRIELFSTVLEALEAYPDATFRPCESIDPVS